MIDYDRDFERHKKHLWRPRRDIDRTEESLKRRETPESLKKRETEERLMRENKPIWLISRV